MEMSQQRKKVAVLGASIASMSGVAPMLMREHRVLGGLWLGFMAVALSYTIVQFVKLKRSGDTCE